MGVNPRNFAVKPGKPIAFDIALMVVIACGGAVGHYLERVDNYRLVRFQVCIFDREQSSKVLKEALLFLFLLGGESF